MIEKFSKDGETLFHKVVNSSLKEITKIKYIFKLSDAGLDINVQSKEEKQTCLHLAILKREIEVIVCLLQNGADLTLTDRVLILIEITMLRIKSLNGFLIEKDGPLCLQLCKKIGKQRAFQTNNK